MSGVKVQVQGTTNEGTTNEGTTNEGTTNEGTTDEGTTNEGTTDEGTTDEGTANEGTTNEGTTNEEEVDVVVIDGTEVQIGLAAAEPWVRDLRKRVRALQQENASLKSSGSATRTTSASPVLKDPGPEPQLENFDLTTDYAEALRKWHKEVADHKAAKAAAERTAADEAAAWEAKVGGYKTKAAELTTKLKLGDFDDYESIVFSELTEVQQGLVIHVCDNPALVVATLATNPKKLREFASVTDNAMYVAKLAKYEASLNITPRKPKTSPEKKLDGGSNAGAGNSVKGTDAKADELLAEAQKTGNMKPYQDYMRDKRKAAAAKK